MAGRGPYSKGLERREDIIVAALELIAVNGYTKTTIRELAAAVGISPTSVVHHFGSKEALYAEILRRRDEVARDSLRDRPSEVVWLTELPTTLSGLAAGSAKQAGLVELYERFSAEATDIRHPAHQYFIDRFASSREGIAALLAEMKGNGVFDEDFDSDGFGSVLIATMEGLQKMKMFDPSLDVGAHIELLWTAILEGGTSRSIDT